MKTIFFCSPGRPWKGGRSRAALLVALAGLAACGRTDPSKNTSEAAPPKPMTVTGVLLEGYTGEPIPSGTLLMVEPLPRPDDVPIALIGEPARHASETALADASGAFRFSRVVRTEEFDRAVLHWRPPDAREVHMLPVFTGGPNPAPVTVPLPPEGEPASDLDLGAVQVWIPDRAGDRFVPICRGGRVDSEPGPPGVIAYERSGGDYSLPEAWVQFAVTAKWPEGWKGVVCISETTSRVGLYESEGDERPVEAHLTRWRVRVIRLPDGRTFERTFEAHPPGVIVTPVYDGRAKGNPVPELTKWLARLGASE